MTRAVVRRLIRHVDASIDWKQDIKVLWIAEHLYLKYYDNTEMNNLDIVIIKMRKSDVILRLLPCIF